MTDLMDVLFDEYNQNCPKELSNIATRAHVSANLLDANIIVMFKTSCACALSENNHFVLF